MIFLKNVKIENNYLYIFHSIFQIFNGFAKKIEELSVYKLFELFPFVIFLPKTGFNGFYLFNLESFNKN